MKILLVNEKCGYFGGVEQNIADTARGLSSRGHKCFLAYADHTDHTAGEFSSLFEGAYRCREIAEAGRFTRLPGKQMVEDFESILRRTKPDVVYVHKITDSRFVLPAATGVRTVRMVHDHNLCCPRRHKYFAFNGRICHEQSGWRCWLDAGFLERNPDAMFGVGWVSIPRLLNEMRRNFGFDMLLVGSRFMLQELMRNGFPAEKLRILPPVVRMPDFKPTPVPDENRILYIGQLVRGKGVDLLFDALHQVPCDFNLTVVGKGPARPKLKAQCRRYGLENRVQFVGWVDRERLSALYRSTKLVVVPSRWAEPFGMIGLEAMNHARPVVGFLVGGIPDWLEHGVTGLLVPEQDVDALARAIERLLNDDGLSQRLGANGYDRVRTLFNFERYIDQLELCLKG